MNLAYMRSFTKFASLASVSFISLVVACSSSPKKITLKDAPGGGGSDAAGDGDGQAMCVQQLLQDIGSGTITPMPFTGSGQAPPDTNVFYYSEKQALGCTTDTHMATQNNLATDAPHTFRAQMLSAKTSDGGLPDELGIIVWENGASGTWPSGATGEAAEGATFPSPGAVPNGDFEIGVTPEADPFIHSNQTPDRQPPGTVKMEVFGYANVDFAANNGQGTDQGFYLAIGGTIHIDQVDPATKKFKGSLKDITLLHFDNTMAAADQCEATATMVTWEGSGIAKSPRPDAPATDAACAAAGSAFAGRDEGTTELLPSQIKYSQPPKFTEEQWKHISAQVEAYKRAHNMK